MANGIAVDRGDAYITGSTNGPLPTAEAPVGGDDAFVAKYTTAGIGTFKWAHEVGTSGPDVGITAAVDSTGSNVYFSGITSGQLPGPNTPLDPYVGNLDAFVTKYSTAGTKIWVHQLGTAGTDGRERGCGR